jgi:hypothetical protein
MGKRKKLKVGRAPIAYEFFEDMEEKQFKELPEDSVNTMEVKVEGTVPPEEKNNGS